MLAWTFGCAQQRVANAVLQLGIWHPVVDALLQRRRIHHVGKWKAASSACSWEEYSKWWAGKMRLAGALWPGTNMKIFFQSQIHTCFCIFLSELIRIWMKSEGGSHTLLELSGKKNIRYSCNLSVNIESIQNQRWRLCCTPCWFLVNRDGGFGIDRWWVLSVYPSSAWASSSIWELSEGHENQTIPELFSQEYWLYYRVGNTYCHVCVELFASPNLLHASQFIKVQFPLG